MSVDISFETDIEGYTKGLTEIQRKIIPRSTNTALNKTAGNVRVAVARYISRISGLKVGEIKKLTIIRKSDFASLQAFVIGRHRPVTNRRFITPGKRRVGAFAKVGGVVANPWRKRRMFPGTFLIRGRTHGRVIPVKRTGSKRKGLKALYGPSVGREFGRPSALRLMNVIARRRFKVNFEHELARNLAKHEARQRKRAG